MKIFIRTARQYASVTRCRNNLRKVTYDKIMKHQFFNVILLLIVVWNSDARVGFGPGEQDWGYVSVRPNATMFWWLFYTTADVKSFYEKPLVIWLEGSPFGSSGNGNFKSIGPLDTDLNPREHNWVNKYNVLFIDSPVGTGFSDADAFEEAFHEEAFATTNKQTATDLLICIKEIFKKDPKLKKVRSYIVVQFFGAKIGIEFARVWYEAKKAGEIESRLRGIAMGSPWISPIDSVMSRAPYLFYTGMVDEKGYKIIEEYANKTKAEIEKKHWKNALYMCDKTVDIIFNNTDVDFDNILTKITYHEGELVKDDFWKSMFHLKSLMNSDVKLKLNLTTDWGFDIFDFIETQKGEIMKPVTDEVEYLLNNTDLKVCVFNGQLGLLVPISGTWNWVNNLRWPYSHKWHSSKRESLIINNTVEGYVKKYNKFSMYWINRSGHMTIKDTPVTVSEIISNFTDES